MMLENAVPVSALEFYVVGVCLHHMIIDTNHDWSVCHFRNKIRFETPCERGYMNHVKLVKQKNIFQIFQQISNRFIFETSETMLREFLFHPSSPWGTSVLYFMVPPTDGSPQNYCTDFD